MDEKTVDKVASSQAHREANGQFTLSRGTQLSMRMWRDEQPSDAKPQTSRAYEVIGYVISGTAELHIEGSVVTLAPGDSWVVAAGASHTYRITQAFTAIEALAPSQ